MLGEAPRIFEEIPPEARELDLVNFLKFVGRPAIFRLQGETSDRCRVISGGMHGNEPSGFHVIHRLLRDPQPIPYDAVLVLGNVRAALFEEPFSHRFMPGEEDFNRVWDKPRDNVLREIAARILDYLTPLPIEAFVDLHNNTGYNPIYSVILTPREQQLAIARCWTHRQIHYGGETLGTFLESIERSVPGVTIECGQAGDPEADQNGLRGAHRFLTHRDLFGPPDWRQEPDAAYHSVARILIPPGRSVAFAEEPTDADFTILPDLDRYNFGVIPAGTPLGYYRGEARLIVTGQAGINIDAVFLRYRDGRIVLTESLTPVMMTSDARAAKSDCLLYIAERLDDDG